MCRRDHTPAYPLLAEQNSGRAQTSRGGATTRPLTPSTAA